ncbi:MAG: hypothetical protein H6933_12280 [Burkholderiaceae bacterium]|nr:hypothetical protein [Burkholderiaceae bacterium]
MSADFSVPLWRIAHARTGDKGDISSIGVVAWSPALYPLIADQLTPEVVARCFAHRAPSSVRRYLLPRLHALNLVLDGALDGGVNRALNLDSHGKALSFLLLDLPMRVPDHLVEHLAPDLPPPQGDKP